MVHIPVLLHEVLFYLNPQPRQDFIDATFGAGGHSRAILERTAPDGRVLALDRDSEAVAAGRAAGEERLRLVHENFANLALVARREGFRQLAGILFDLGLSSNELDDPVRGFSFQKDGSLDMRFDRTGGPTAGELLAKSNEQQLTEIFRRFGEERHAHRIAAVIVRQRRTDKLATTGQLFELIKSALPAPVRFRASDSARRIFQALRIALNDELKSLQAALPQALQLLGPSARLAVISFHSLEDRIVKQFFKSVSKGCVCPLEFPVCMCGRNPEAMIRTRKPVRPSAQEVASNPRARPAKLRVLEKL